MDALRCLHVLSLFHTLKGVSRLFVEFTKFAEFTNVAQVYRLIPVKQFAAWRFPRCSGYD